VRAKYETEQDLKHENSIAAAACKAFNCRQYKLSKRKADSGVDRLFLRDRKIVAVAEIKDRRGWKPEYGTVILGVTKVIKMMTLAKALSVPALFIVRLPDNIYWVNIERYTEWEVGEHGRIDRQDPDDVEPCYRIPFDEFKPLFP